MENMFKFTKKDGIVTLVEYFNENQDKIIVPATFEGEPVIAIGDRVFEFSKFKEIVLPDSIESFGNSAFYWCESLKKINIPKNLKIVKQNAFGCCSSLVDITFPVGVEKISANCFNCCDNLKTVFAENENAILGKNAIGEGVNLEKISFHLIKHLSVHHQTKFIVEFIKDFDNIEQDKKDVILSLIKKKSLKDSLFLSGDTEVISFLLNNKIKPNLKATEGYLEHYLKKQKNTKITAIFLDFKNKSFKKENVKDINERKELVEIGLKPMNYTEFKNLWVCSKKDGNIRVSGYKGNKLEENIPSQVDGVLITMLGTSNIQNFSPIKVLNIYAPIEIIVDRCFAFRELKEIHLPDTLIAIGKSAFYSCEKLESITIPASVKEIGDEAFGYCSKLKKITFLGDIPILGKNVFKNTPIEKDFV